MRTHAPNAFCRSPARNGMVVEPKVARRFQTQIEELKGTNRDTATCGRRFWNGSKTLKIANQHILDLKEGFCMGRDEWVSTYIAKGVVLIELLEIHDCGSVGGFDTDVGGDSLHGLLYLEQRFEALKRKYERKLSPKKKSRGGLSKTPRQSLFGGILVDAS
jgi:hypothetical protein